MSISSKSDLMDLCISQLPTEEFEVSNGVIVKISALKGSDTSRIFSNPNMDEKILNTLRKGLISPILSNKELIRFIDYAPEDSINIFTKIMEMSNALGDAEQEKLVEAKKN